MAEKLGRKWIVSDLGKFAIHTTRKRLIGVQRQRKEEGKSYRAFEILNLGKYERQHFIETRVQGAPHEVRGDDSAPTPSPLTSCGAPEREMERAKMLAAKEAAFVVTKETLTKHLTDWIDFDFESKKEILRVKDEATGELVERWTGDFIFENEWQSFRTKKDRSLELTSAASEVAPGRKRVKIAVKVVDIFGNDTMTIVDVAVKSR